jgi:hypothetical protein
MIDRGDLFKCKECAAVVDDHLCSHLERNVSLQAAAE